MKLRLTAKISNKTAAEDWRKKYDEVGKFSEGLASVLLGDYDNGKWGFVNRQGKVIRSTKMEKFQL